CHRRRGGLPRRPGVRQHAHRGTQVPERPLENGGGVARRRDRPARVTHIVAMAIPVLQNELPPAWKLEEEIERLKKERNAVILAHYYQESEIQDLADHVGDSLGLARAAQKA